ncbi:aldose 1-epimerase family protein [Lacinutrix sp. Bg11-31]|uniref:aldose 1-epimerase family protein n=1 Tax=Lacinutrix sp. Bg11-31 TaxID=2057808 RepID=UPI000C315D91|nr:aldose 1-epimerase family protein [Lacinutrix sp. Bg11-31]AUC81231.1 aldose epimerase [Lacinutrix sp. Bg11-31]
MFELSNSILKIKVKPIGAELCEISSVKNNTQFMWDANPDIWGSFAPNLFPIIGALKDETYFYKGTKYNMPKHGFVRHSKDIKLVKETKNSLSFSLTYNEDLLKIYPFKFEFKITYTLIDNILDINYTVKNLDNKSIYFSVGGHPAFKCPLYNDENYTDYNLVFETEETSKTHLLNTQTGLVKNETKPVFTTKNSIQLNPNLFSEDALIFKDLKSRKVALVSTKHGEILNMTFKDFNYLGLWAKPNAPYVCIEPWLGIADQENTSQNIVEKEGIIKLPENETFSTNYSVQIHEHHLG